MKKVQLLLFLFAIIYTPNTLFAQETKAPLKILEVRELGVSSATLLDTITFIYNDQNQLLERRQIFKSGEQSVETYTYNENNKVTSFTQITIKNGGVLRGNRLLSSYDEKGNLIQYTRELLLSNDWTGSTRINYYYDEQDNLINETYQEFEKGLWNKIRRIIYDYDNRKNLILIKKQDLGFESGIFSNWINKTQTVISYDEHNRDTLSVFQDRINTNWVVQRQVSKRYDSQNNLITRLTNFPNNFEFKDTLEEKWMYDDDNRLVFSSRENLVIPRSGPPYLEKIVENIAYDDSGRTLRNEEKYFSEDNFTSGYLTILDTTTRKELYSTYELLPQNEQKLIAIKTNTYNDIGKLVTILSQDVLAEDTTNNSKINYEYTENGAISKQSYEVWQVDNWLLYTSKFNQYNDLNELIYSEEYFKEDYIQIHNNLVPFFDITKKTFYQKPLSVSVQEIEKIASFTVYPNPTNGSLFLKMKESTNLPLEASLYTIAGHLVHSFMVDSPSQQVELPHSLSSGIYLLQLKNEQLQITKKIQFNSN